MSRLLPVVAVAAGALTAALAGCGSSSGTASSASTAPPSSAQAATPPSSAAPAVQAPVSGPVPAVSGASDLSKEPTIAPGFGAPPSVLTDADLVAGTGPAASPTATVNVQYVGALYTTGQVFDASWAHGGPVSFSLDQVVPGFRDAIAGMKVGGRREVVIPPALGYGSQGNASIPPNSTLVFVIDLLSASG
jgi:peptidylprolyl isomerase